MFDKLFDTFGNDPQFRKIIESMVDDMVIEVNNDLKFKKTDVEDEVIGAVLLICIRNNLSFEFLRSINLAINGADDIVYGNVNDFINKLEGIYNQGEALRQTKTNEYGE